MKRFSSLFLASLLSLCFFSACERNDDDTTGSGNGGSTTASTAVYYADSTKIYSTSLTGTNRKLVVGIDTLNPNSYIGSMALSPDGNKLYFFHFISGGSSVRKFYSVNKDGTGLTALKTLNNSTEYGFLKATSDNKLAFYQATFNGSAFVNTIESITTDGTTQTTLAPVPGNAGLPIGLSVSGNRYLTLGFGSFINLGTGTVSSSTVSVPISVNSDVYSSNANSLSQDGSKIAYTKLNNGKLDVYVYDVAAATSALKFSHTVAADVPTLTSFSTGLRWIGNDKLMLYYSKFTSPQGAVSDFTNLTVYNAVSGTQESNWRFTGDAVTNIITQ